MLHEDLKHIYNAFPKDAHPMAILSCIVCALSTFYPDVGIEDQDLLRLAVSVYWENCQRLQHGPIKKVQGIRWFIPLINMNIVKTFWCGNEECEEKIKSEGGGAKSLNMPFKQPKKFGKCVYCRRDGEYLIYFGKSY